MNIDQFGSNDVSYNKDVMKSDFISRWSMLQ